MYVLTGCEIATIKEKKSFASPIKGWLFDIIARNLCWFVPKSIMTDCLLNFITGSWKKWHHPQIFPTSLKKEKNERESYTQLWIDFWINALSLPHLSRNVKLFILLSGDTQCPCESLSVVMKWWHWVWNQLLLQHQRVSCKHFTRGTKKALNYKCKWKLILMNSPKRDYPIHYFIH